MSGDSRYGNVDTTEVDDLMDWPVYPVYVLHVTHE